MRSVPIFVWLPMRKTGTPFTSDSPSWPSDVSVPERARAPRRFRPLAAWTTWLRAPGAAAQGGAVALCAILMLLLSASTSLAGGKDRVLIVPLSGHASEIPAAVPGRFTRALVRMHEARGADVTVAQASLEDTLAIVGCSAQSASCLDQAAAVLEADRIVFGRVEAGDETGTWKVFVTVAIRGEQPVEHWFPVAAASADEAEDAFAAQAGPVFGRARARPADRPAASERTVGNGPGAGGDTRPAGRPGRGDRRKANRDQEQDATQKEQSDDAGSQGSTATAPVPASQGHAGTSTPARFDADRVARSSWVITGTGGGLMGTGVLFWLLARERQEAVNAAPADSAADLEHLVALEDGVKTRAIIGNTLFLAGTVTVAIGLTLAFKQARTSGRTSITLSPVPLRDGVGVVLRMGGI